jgi:hypothetical protein
VSLGLQNKRAAAAARDSIVTPKKEKAPKAARPSRRGITEFMPQSLQTLGLLDVGMGLKVRAVTVTHLMAKVWLKTSPRNRHMYPALVAKYKRAMAGSRWLLSGEPVIFNAHGQLIDAHHRLQACVESEIPFETLVVYGVDPEAFRILNTGRARTAGDMLAIEGYAYAHVLAAMVYFFYEVYGAEEGKERPDHTEVERLVQLRPDMAASAATKHRLTWRPLQNATFALLHHLCGQVSVADRDRFFEQLDLGTGLEKGDPIWALRRLLEMTATARSRADRKVILAVAIKAWNAWRRENKKPVKDRKPVGVLSWKAGKEPFPLAE